MGAWCCWECGLGFVFIMVGMFLLSVVCLLGLYVMGLVVVVGLEFGVVGNVSWSVFFVCFYDSDVCVVSVQ